MKNPDILAALQPVVETILILGGEYYIGGSIASSVYGLARATLDVDIVAHLDSKEVRAFVKRLKPKFYVDEGMIQDAIRRKASFNLIHLETMLKIDVFVRRDRAYDRQACKRCREEILEPDRSRTFKVASPEDVILNKLEWYRKGEKISERQWLDVLGVLKVQHDRLDYRYLRRWSGQLGIVRLLNRAIREARED